MNAMHNPLISIIIPTHNRLDLTRRAIESVFRQTYPNYEVVLVDDASTEDLKTLLKEFPEKLRVIRNEISLGAQRSRLRGAEDAKGSFVALLDSDDWWAPEKLEKQIQQVTEKPHALVSCRVIIVGGMRPNKIAPKIRYDGSELVSTYLFVKGGLLQTSTFFAQKDILVKLLRKTENSIVCNDPSISLEAESFCLPIIQLEEPLVYFDCTDRYDRISLEKTKIIAAEKWLSEHSKDWDELTRKGFMYNDIAIRYKRCGQKRRALETALKYYDHSFGLMSFLKHIGRILLTKTIANWSAHVLSIRSKEQSPLPSRKP